MQLQPVIVVVSGEGLVTGEGEVTEVEEVEDVEIGDVEEDVEVEARRRRNGSLLLS